MRKRNPDIWPGKAMGGWTVLSAVKGKNSPWECVCRCGRIGLVQAEKLRSGTSNCCRECAGRAATKLSRRAADKSTDQFSARLTPLLLSLRQAGMSYRGIADNLNDRGIRTREKKLWSVHNVAAYLSRHSR